MGEQEESDSPRRPDETMSRAIRTYRLAVEQLNREVHRSGVLGQHWAGLRNGDAQDAYALVGLLLQATRVGLVLEAWVGGATLHNANQSVPPVAP